MPRSRLLQSMQLGGIYLSSIIYICILFTSPNHLGNWQVTVTWKVKALKNPKAADQKAENWLLSIRLRLKKPQHTLKNKITNGGRFASVFAFCFECRVMSSHFLLQPQGQGKKKGKLIFVLSLMLSKADTWNTPPAPPPPKFSEGYYKTENWYQGHQVLL